MNFIQRYFKAAFAIVLLIGFGWYFVNELQTHKDDLYVVLEDSYNLIPHLVGVVVFMIIAILIRAIRWQIMLGKNHLLGSCFRSVAIGYLIQVPLSKFGEIVRVTNQKKNSNCSLGEILSTIFIDRILDVASLLILLIFLMYYSGEVVADRLPELQSIFPKLMFFFAIAFIALLLLFFAGGFLKDIIAKLPLLPAKVKQSFISLIDKMQEGTRFIKSFKRMIFLFISTLAIWVSYFICFYLAVAFYPQVSHDVNIQDILFVFTVGTVGVLVPVPGGLAYPLFVQRSLMIVSSVSEAEAIGIATVVYLVNFWIANLICGGGSFLWQAIFPYRPMAEEK
ncbi:MAG: flippase-like domain-containing protein [Planctomycetes bacterium]|nr:flippase-like domain-containing protein [Planctomycetota bacterium]